MMNIKKAVRLVFLIVIVLTYACENKTDPPNREEEIKAGSYDNMKTSSHDTPIRGGYNDPESYLIDLDGDGIDDIKFVSELWGSPAVGAIPKATMMVINSEVGVLGYFSNDTSFMNTKIHDNANIETAFDKVIQYSQSCQRISAGDSILQVYKSFEIQPLENNDVFGHDDVFENDTIILANGDYSLPLEFAEQVGDTVWYSFSTFNVSCNKFPLEEIKYIGVRFNSGPKLGWIKLSLIDEFEIMLYETAVQK